MDLEHAFDMGYDCGWLVVADHVLGKHYSHEPSWSKACIEDLKKIKWPQP